MVGWIVYRIPPWFHWCGVWCNNLIMKRKTKKHEYKSSQMSSFVGFICEKYNLDVLDVVKSLKTKFPELSDRSHCANCDASMSMYEFSITSLDLMLLLQMGAIVGTNLKAGMTFTEANKVHISTSIKGTNSSRQTISSKLGLITKVLRKDGSHDRNAGWLITRRGFELLGGKPVPRKVQVFRNQITERFDEMITRDKIAYDKNSHEGIEIGRYDDYPFDKLELYAEAGFAQGRLM